ncbi:MAG TPA: DUF2089 family protein [Candidatus Sabulitectum sp.]|nr:DUF2089 family protein [Candidatus Sabulitectum sp.]HRW78139.1 DUF2089 family protein [Candidatus Sabulitectum sp.]
MSRAQAPTRCPSCSGVLNPVKYVCSQCGTEVSGDFSVCPFCSMDGENRRLLELFLLARGNLKAVQRMLGVSYPTARTRIEEMFNTLEARMSGEERSMDILEKLHSGEISVEDAIDSLSGGNGENT